MRYKYFLGMLVLALSGRAAIANYAGHMQSPNAPEPEQLFSVAPEIAQINTPMLFLIGEQDYELRRTARPGAGEELVAPAHESGQQPPRQIMSCRQE